MHPFLCLCARQLQWKNRSWLENCHVQFTHPSLSPQCLCVPCFLLNYTELYSLGSKLMFLFLARNAVIVSLEGRRVWVSVLQPSLSPAPGLCSNCFRLRRHVSYLLDGFCPSVWCVHNSMLFLYSFFRIYLSLERGGETSTGSLLQAANQGPGSWSRRVPWLGIEPVTSPSAGLCPIHWATPARVTTPF